MRIKSIGDAIGIMRLCVPLKTFDLTFLLVAIPFSNWCIFSFSFFSSHLTVTYQKNDQQKFIDGDWIRHLLGWLNVLRHLLLHLHLVECNYDSSTSIGNPTGIQSREL